MQNILHLNLTLEFFDISLGIEESTRFDLWLVMYSPLLFLFQDHRKKQCEGWKLKNKIITTKAKKHMESSTTGFPYNFYDRNRCYRVVDRYCNLTHMNRSEKSCSWKIVSFTSNFNGRAHTCGKNAQTPLHRDMNKWARVESKKCGGLKCGGSTIENELITERVLWVR